MNVIHSRADLAESSTRSSRGYYRPIAFATLVMMLFGSLVLTPMAASAAQTETTAMSNLRTDSSMHAATLGAVPDGITTNSIQAASFQTGSSVVGLLINVLLDIRAFSLNAAEAPAAPASGSEGGIVGIIYAAADAYGQPREDMLRVATCESNLDPGALNASSQASGLFQFLPSTWATTPYADQNIFDPVASANAAAWMWDNGRRGEWVCQ